jgi:hypothetical protein
MDQTIPQKSNFFLIRKVYSTNSWQIKIYPKRHLATYICSKNINSNNFNPASRGNRRNTRENAGNRKMMMEFRWIS